MTEVMVKQRTTDHLGSKSATPYTGIIQKYLNESNEKKKDHKRKKEVPFTPVESHLFNYPARSSDIIRADNKNAVKIVEDSERNNNDSISSENFQVSFNQEKRQNPWKKNTLRLLRISLSILLVFPSKIIHQRYIFPQLLKVREGTERARKLNRPDFVFEHPYITSSYYTVTTSTVTLDQTVAVQIEPKKDRLSDQERGIVSRLAVVRPFCEFDAEALPESFACWNSFAPCRAAEDDLGDSYNSDDNMNEWVLFNASANATGRILQEDGEENWECQVDYSNTSWFQGITGNIFKKCKRKAKDKKFFDDVPIDTLRSSSADLFLFYSQSFSDSPIAVRAVDTIMNEYFSPGGWSRCFDNIYAIEANIPPELDLYIPTAQDELYNWVNGPNRQFEAAFRIIQSGEWGSYDAFYLMEGDSVPVKNYWLDVILEEIDAHRPFAVLGAQYDGDKWDAFYEKIPISLLHHTNGNGIYNTSHPLLERLVGQLEVEAPCPYNSIPYDYRMSQIWVEGTLGIVPTLAKNIMLNEEGKNITLSDNTAMFAKWATRWQDERPYKYTKAIRNYAATNLIPRHLGPEYIIHGAKLYSPWDPTKIKITLVVSEWFFDRSLNLIKSLDSREHPFDEVIIMIPASVSINHDYSKYTKVPVTLQFRDAPDFMDLCAAEVTTEWFMITNSYHQVARHVDLMFTPGKFVPVIPFTPATYSFCFVYPYCKEIVSLAQRWNPNHKQVVLDMDMLYNTEQRDAFCEEWKVRNGENGEDLYAKYQPLRFRLRGDKIIGPKGPTGTDYLAYLMRENKDSIYKMTDRSLYGARAPFVKVYKKEEKLDGLSVDELVRRLGPTLVSNVTDCSCDIFDTEQDCINSDLGCHWRPLFESCHPPEMIDGDDPVCRTTEAPTMSPSISIEGLLSETESPTIDDFSSKRNESNTLFEGIKVEGSLSSLVSFFKSREHEMDSVSNNDTTTNKGNTSTSNDHRSLQMKLGENDNNIFNYFSNLTNGSSGSKVFHSSFPSSSETTKMCPTWGPSYVHREIDDFLPINDAILSTVKASDHSVLKAAQAKNFLPGRARHTQHQLVHLEWNQRLTADVLTLPSSEDSRSRRLVLTYGEEKKNLRILFETTPLTAELNELKHDFVKTNKYHETKARITAYLEVIFPSVAKLWGDFLMINSPLNSIFPKVKTCGTISVPPQHLSDGVSNADVIIYTEIRDQSLCFLDSKPQVKICHFDQNMRPLIASLSICLESIELQDKKVYENEILRHVSLITQLVGRFLGLSPSLFKYFRNPETGQEWGERPVLISCDDSGDSKKVNLSRVIEQRKAPDGELYYEISTPTVRQVVRNHFDCQSLSGARLSPPLLQNDNTCAFLSLDLRYHFDDDLTAISQNADAAFAISPLSLALLEDSSWYKANFSIATTPVFGRAAGCGFVFDRCITGGKVPDYSKGYFCNTPDDLGSRSGCDFTHRNKAGCDLNKFVNPPPKFQYFHPDRPKFGSVYADVDYCPMRSHHLLSCSSKSKIASFSNDDFIDDRSRCYETDAGTSICLETICNSEDKSLSFIVQGKSYPCKFHGEIINVGGYSVLCPRIAAVCPDLVCPSNCSGKGICDYCKKVPSCVCDNPFDESPGCWDS